MKLLNRFAWKDWFAQFTRKKPVTLGLQGEHYAAKFLKKQGYKIIVHSARSRWAEIDLIAVDNRTVVFVEVKTRRSNAKGEGYEAVDHRKRKKITQAALAFLKSKNLLENRARFDVISITWPKGAKQPALRHFKDAFPAEGHGQLYS